jgi:cytidylate kinase
MSTYPHVAIDGPAASGKTTVAREVAAQLGALYLDTGSMYRAAALAVLREGVEPAEEQRVLAALAKRPVLIEPDPGEVSGFRVLCGGEDAGAELYSEAVDGVVSIVAAHPLVRDEMVRIQRAIAARGTVVMAGRDIGTVVLPDAAVKVFLTATPEARAARRALELLADGAQIDAGRVRMALDERDRIDENRAVAPLTPAAGATVIDSSEIEPEEVVRRIVALARARARP